MSSSIAVLATCFNRKTKTLASLAAVYRQRCIEGVGIDVYLTDDGSHDGTADAVRAAFPSVRILEGDGTLYWAGGMRRAWEAARRHGYDHYLWLNDDTLLHADAVARLLSAYADVSDPAAIVVGTVRDPASGKVTYGGVRREKGLRFRFSHVEPSDRPRRCDTMNGNCVLVPRAVVEHIGLVSDAFTHGTGDFDYGLRAWKNGCSVWVAPGTVGVCERDHIPAGSWRDPTLRRKERWRLVRQPKGLPPREYLTFTRRHGGPFWPLHWLSPYLRILLGR